MGGAMMADHLSSGEMGREHAMMNNFYAVQNLLDVDVPSVSQMRIQLEELVQQGVLDPQLAEEYLQASTQMANIDPAYQESQMGALRELEGIVDQDGMDAQARAALHQLKGQTQAAERGSREAILENAAARGVGGSGLELASQLAGQQGSATNMANQGFQAAADANQRKMQAIQGVGQLGGQLWGQGAQEASAQDTINKFNTANKLNWRNTAEMQNQAEKQRISDQNTGIKNMQEMHNKNLYQQEYNNALTRGQSLSNANLGAAQGELGVYSSSPYQTELAGMSAKWSDENLKTDISPVDTKAFMDGLTGYKYKFKDSEFGEGDQVGVMAQDLEKVAPQAVINTPRGKKVDYSKLGGPVLAALASLNERVDELEGE